MAILLFSLKILLITLLAMLMLDSSARAAQKPSDKNKGNSQEVVQVLMSANDRFSEGEYAEAGKLYERLIAMSPKNREAYLGLGRIALLKGDRARALSMFEKAVEYAPQSADAQFELGSTHLSLGNFSEALKELTLANQLDPQRPEIHYRLAQARSLVEASHLIPDGNEKPPVKEAGNSADHSDNKDDSPRAGRGLIRSKQKLLEKMRMENSQKIDQTSEVSLVYRLITSGRVDETIEQGLNALKHQPDNASLRYQLGLMYKVQGEVDKAISTFEDALQHDPEHVPTLSQLSQLYLSRNEIDKARQVSSRWVEADPDNPNAHFSLAWSYIQDHSFKEAMPHLKSAAQLDPANTELLNHVGLALREMGKDQEATQYFQRAMSMSPDAQSPRLNLAMIYLYDQRDDEAKRLIRPLEEKTPVTPHVLSVAALIDAREGRLEEAKRLGNEVLKSTPDQALAVLALAVVARLEGRLDEAETMLKSAIAKRSSNVLFQHALAEVYLEKNNLNEAIDLARQAHEKSPDKYLIARTLVLALAKANDTTVALDTLRRMKELGDDPDKLFLLERDILDTATDKAATLKHYSNLAAGAPDDDELALKVAYLQILVGKPKNASVTLNRILSHSPANNQARLLTARVLLQLKDYKGCLKQCAELPRDDDTEYEISCIAARANFRLKKFGDAAKNFKTARNHKQLSGDDLVMMAKSLKETRETSESMVVLSEARLSKNQSKDLQAELRRLERTMQ